MAGTGVTLSIGDQRRIFGQLMGSAELLEDDPRVQKAMRRLEAAVEAAVADARQELHRIGDSDRLVREHGRAIAQAIADRPFSEPAGLAVRVIREAVGMPRAELARRIGRDRGSLARWETGTAGRAARWTVVDVQRAGEALGYNPTALYLVADAARNAYHEAMGARR